mgnify:FL=1
MNFKTISAAVMMIAGLQTASMAADTAFPTSVNLDRTGAYVGGSLGSSTGNFNERVFGVDAGFQIGKHLRAGADIDKVWRSDREGYRAMVNGIVQYRIPNTVVTPYVLAGAGYSFNGLSTIRTTNSERAIWDVGAGTRIAVSESVELDARYREIRPMNRSNSAIKQDHVFSAGVNYRF